MGKLLLTFAALTTIVLFAGLIADDSLRPDAQKIAFKTWMARHGKSYRNDEEFTYRLSMFKKNALYVAEHNLKYAAGLVTFDLELNKFADMDINEFIGLYAMKDFKVTSKCTGPQAPSDNLPDTVDWAAKGNPLSYSRCRYRYQEPGTMWIMLGLLDHRLSGGCLLPQEQEPPKLLRATTR
jgi:xylem cysteine proteinase